MTVISDYVSRMVDGGMEEEEAMQIATELFAAGVASAAFRPSKGALRTRAWRERERHKASHSDGSETPSENVTKRHKASQSVTGDTQHKEEDKKYKKDSMRPTSRGTRIDPDWAPSELEVAFAKQSGLIPDEISREVRKFKNYWGAKSGRDACKINWSMTWRNWIENAVERIGRKPIAEPVAAAEIEIESAIKLFAKIGRWSRHAGPEPGQIGCRAPPELLAKYGLLPDGRKMNPQDQLASHIQSGFSPSTAAE